VVRGPAAVLAAVALAAAYFLAVSAFPALHPEKTSLLVAGVAGAVGLAVSSLAVVPLVDTPVLIPLVLLGAGLIVAALDVAKVGAAASVPEAVLYGTVGVAFAALLDAPALALVLPIFVGAIDAVSVFAGPSKLLAHGMTQPGDPLSLELPEWHTRMPAGRIGVSDVVFVAVFAAYARRFDLRLRAAAVGMMLGLAGAVVVHVELDRTIPALPFVGAGFLLPNLDRAWTLFRTRTEG
jgi:hypothetical protein